MAFNTLVMRRCLFLLWPLYISEFFAAAVYLDSSSSADTNRLPDVIRNQTGLDEAFVELSRQVSGEALNATKVASLYANVLDSVEPAKKPLCIREERDAINNIYGSRPKDIIKAAFEVKLSGLSGPDAHASHHDDKDSCDRPQPADVPPKGTVGDPPYTVPESTLRAAVDIPAAYEYGTGGKIPVILVPGTAISATRAFSPNYLKLLSATNFADPILLNLPQGALNDLQVSAEYVAYAMNYVSQISRASNVSVFAWSQGTLNVQWALKYWPSTREVTSDFIAISAEFHGGIESDITCPGFARLPCDAAVLQQSYDSKYVAVLRSNGGDSAFVPTTSIYSAFDEVILPQVGTGASAYLQDDRHAGASNNELQELCPGLPAGGVYTHAGVLYNPVTYALVTDALLHNGPANPQRIDLASACKTFVTQGLSLDDVLATDATVVLASIIILQYEPKVTAEPAIMPYALQA